MRGLFNRSDEPVPGPGVDPAAGGGWNGLSGRSKMGILGGVAVASLIAIMWPSFNSKPPPPATMPEQHPPAPISDYRSPPPVQEITARVMGDPPRTAPVLRRPRPTEMTLFTVKPPYSMVPEPAAAHPSTAAGSTPTTEGLPPTNRASLVHNPDFLIRAGDSIPCLPVEAQNSSRPSFSTCQVPNWFRSSNQRRGLLPPHTRLFGQIRKGLQAGEERYGIVYSLIQTPNFDMPIDASAGDAQGRGGVDGDVKTFFWDKAGAVALYALMDVGIGIGQSAGQAALSRSLSNNYGGTSLNINGPAQSLASREFDATMNKPPVSTRDWALPVTVIVGQNLDFYDACMQAMRVDPMACPRQ